MGREILPLLDHQIWKYIMHILVTNDDGVQAPGLLALVAGNAQTRQGDGVRAGQELVGFGTREDDGPSPAGAGNGSRRRDACLHLRRRAFGLCRHSPAGLRRGGHRPGGLGHQSQRQHRARHHLLRHGHRRDGGGHRGREGIAISLDSPEGHKGALDYSTAAVVGRRVAKKVMIEGVPDGVVLNVNVPYLKEEKLARAT
ncbi:MAG: hypothetical protein MZV64_17350 [Ignavibacteriales bacterium]|nr:hypothetical protein [Ignavibacteriales bacterium]